MNHRYRSAITGRFVSAAYAKRWPHKTVREAVSSPTFNAYVKGRRE